ncbi:MAG: hypothetical protein LUQ24_08840 [Methanobacterium sp.]|nr:hypothetical protein [Methanobacterium sp.]
MNKSSKFLLILGLFIGIIILYLVISPLFIHEESFQGFNGDNNHTIIVCYSTGDMKGIEVGVASYAGREGIPLILSSKNIPYPLNDWIPSVLDKGDIKKVIVVGPVSQWQIYLLKMNKIEIEVISGQTKAGILTEIAEKSFQSLDTVIITSSDPSASLLGAYMDLPVFVVAEPGKYTSDEYLAPEYENFMDKYKIKRVIIVGSISDNIKDKLTAKNIRLDEIRGNDSYWTSVLVSDRVKDILKQRGLEVNSAYCGFYGELPSIIPLAVNNNSIMLIDPTLHMDDAVNYLKTNGIVDVVITRNGPADYIQMEEPDFVSKTFINKLGSVGIKTNTLTNFRTINEATGLFETKMMTAEQLLGLDSIKYNQTESAYRINFDPSSINQFKNLETSRYPPILAIVLKGGDWRSSTGSELIVRQIGLNEWYYSWKGIHPYIWYRNNTDDWYCYSGSQYSWHWIGGNKTDNGNINKNSDIWTVEYLSDGKVYNRVYWVKRGIIWEEVHSEASFNWKYENSWICYQDKVDGVFILYKSNNPFF